MKKRQKIIRTNQQAYTCIIQVTTKQTELTVALLKTPDPQVRRIKIT